MKEAGLAAIEARWRSDPMGGSPMAALATPEILDQAKLDTDALVAEVLRLQMELVAMNEEYYRATCDDK